MSLALILGIASIAATGGQVVGNIVSSRRLGRAEDKALTLQHEEDKRRHKENMERLRNQSQQEEQFRGRQLDLEEEKLKQTGTQVKQAKEDIEREYTGGFFSGGESGDQKAARLFGKREDRVRRWGL